MNGVDIDVLGYEDNTPFHATSTENISGHSGESNTEVESRRKGA